MASYIYICCNCEKVEKTNHSHGPESWLNIVFHITTGGVKHRVSGTSYQKNYCDVCKLTTEHEKVVADHLAYILSQSS